MAKIQYRVLGTSGIKVSQICLGTMMFGGPTEEAEARRIIDHALESGRQLHRHRRRLCPGAVGGDHRPRHQGQARPLGARDQARAVDGAGRHRFRALAALHDAGGGGEPEAARRPTTSTSTTSTASTPTRPGSSTIAAFGDLIRQGKVREWALSNVRAWHIPHVVHLCRQLGVPPPVALQPYYNLMNRQPEVELLPAARTFGLGVVPYSPIARGVLAGKYKVNQKADPGSRAGRQDKRMLESEWRPESLMIAEKLKEHAESARHDADRLGGGLGAQQPRHHRHDRRPPHLRAVDELFPRPRLQMDRRGRGARQQPGHAGPRLHPRASTIRPTPSRAGSRRWGEVHPASHGRAGPPSSLSRTELRKDPGDEPRMTAAVGPGMSRCAPLDDAPPLPRNRPLGAWHSGSALPSHGRGHRFDPCRAHHSSPLPSKLLAAGAGRP